MSSFQSELALLCSSLSGICKPAAERGLEAIEEAVGVEVPALIRAFTAKEEVGQAPARLQALAKALSRSLLVEVGELRKAYGRDTDPQRLAADLTPFTAHVRELQLQALLTLQLGSMCLLPGVSRGGVGGSRSQERDPLPKAVVKRVGGFLGDLQLKQAFGGIAPPSSPSSSGGPESGVSSSFEELTGGTLVRLFGRDFPRTLLLLYRLLDCDVPDGLLQSLSEGPSEPGAEEEGEEVLTLRRPRSSSKKRQLSFKPRYSFSGYPQFVSVMDKKTTSSSDRKQGQGEQPSSSGGQGAAGKKRPAGAVASQLGSAAAAAAAAALPSAAAKRGRLSSSHYLHRNLSGMRKLVANTTAKPQQHHNTTGAGGGMKKKPQLAGRGLSSPAADRRRQRQHLQPGSSILNTPPAAAGQHSRRTASSVLASPDPPRPDGDSSMMMICSPVVARGGRQLVAATPDEHYHRQHDWQQQRRRVVDTPP